MRADLQLVVLVMVEKATGNIRTFLQSPLAGSNEAMELWCSIDGRFAAFHNDAYYDEQLLSRRRNGRMVHPDAPRRPMHLVGEVWGAATYDISEYVEVARTVVTLREVPIDER